MCITTSVTTQNQTQPIVPVVPVVPDVPPVNPNTTNALKTVPMAPLSMTISGGLSAAFDGNGLSRLLYNGITLVDTAADPEEKYLVEGYLIKHSNGATETLDGTAPGSFNSQTNELTKTYSWGKVVAQYSINGNKLTITNRIINQSSSDTISAISLVPLTVHFPVVPAGFGSDNPAAIHFNAGDPSIIGADFSSGVASFVNVRSILVCGGSIITRILLIQPVMLSG
jgi:hypothetical protein